MNPNMNITCFGLNCAAPEDIIAALDGMFTKKNKDDVDFEQELKQRNIGFCVYANLNDRRKAHLGGYDRSKDNPNYINRRDELVSGDHAGYCEALEQILTNFKAVTHIGGCCGTLPEGIRSLQTRFF